MAGLSPTHFLHLCCCAGGFWSFPRQNSFSDPESAKFKQLTPSASMHCVASKRRQLSGDFFWIWYVLKVIGKNHVKSIVRRNVIWTWHTEGQTLNRQQKQVEPQRPDLLVHEKFLHSEFKKTGCSGTYVCRLFVNLQQLPAVRSNTSQRRTAMKLPLLLRLMLAFQLADPLQCSVASSLGLICDKNARPKQDLTDPGW